MNAVVIPIRAEATDLYPECEGCVHRDGGEDCDPCDICWDADEFEPGD